MLSACSRAYTQWLNADLLTQQAQQDFQQRVMAGEPMIGPLLELRASMLRLRAESHELFSELMVEMKRTALQCRAGS
jgi:hypothetical protein